MNRLFIISLLLIFSSLVSFGQAETFTLRGKVVNANDETAIQGANVVVVGSSQQTLTDKDGVFVVNVEIGDMLIIEHSDMETVEVEVSDISDITVAMSPLITEDESDFDSSVISLSADEIESDSQSHDISRLLAGSRDVYVNTAGYDFGQARYRIRGYDSENTLVLMNGVPVNDMETGRAYYSNWGGLNDATRMTEGYSGIGVMRSTFGRIGGATNITTRASQFRRTSKVTYSLANRSYSNRIMLTHASGVMDNGWSFAVSGSRRWADEGYVEGTFYDAWGYFLSAEKLFNDNHSVGLIVLGAPSRRGSQGVSTQEVYDLAGSNYYNSNWGYQNGEKRNARVGTYHQPLSILSHYWDLTDNTLLTTSAALSFGRGGRTALNWYDAQDPRPDYYRYVPSYYPNDPQMAEYYNDQWQNNPEFGQLDWNSFYEANVKNLYSVADADGIEGNTVTGNRSKYLLEERRIDHQRITLTSNIESLYSENLVLSGGVNVRLHKGYQFKVVDDLMGGDWWLDVDQFAERDFADPYMSQTDVNNPNRLVEEGDKFGYDYIANVNDYEGYGQAQFFFPKYDFYVAANLSHTTFWRTGNMKNPRFPDNSFGDSEKQNFTNFGFKGGFTYKFSGRHYVETNLTYMTRAPFFWNSYVSPRVRDNLVTGLSNETIYGGDLSYIIRTPRIKSRLTVFYTEFKDQTWSRSFYHDELRTFVNYIMTDVDKRHLGAELGIDINITSTLSGHIVAGTGDYIYNSRPIVTIARDNDFEVIQEQRIVYLQNYKVGGMTHTAASVGLRYNSPKYWFVGLSGSYFDDIYIDINPDRRTEEAVSDFVVEDGVWEDVINQEQLKHNFTVNMFGGKSWRINRKYFIRVNVSVNNLLNNTGFAMGGFEQLRYNNREVDRFPPKYFYLYGRSYFINLSFNI
ncbi:MAG: TonB-dependent receptor plug domain-containing protein [Bacteroidota bacterium]